MNPEVSIDRVLVPVDGSDAAERAVEHGIAVADRYDAALHALYVFDPEEARELRRSEGDDAAAADAESFLDSVRTLCDDRGVASTSSTALGFSTGRLSQHPGSVILDCAEDVDADFVVVPREAPTKGAGVLAKAAEYVLSYASQPVLSV